MRASATFLSGTHFLILFNGYSYTIRTTPYGYMYTAYTGLLIGPFGAAVPCTPVRATAYAYGPMRQGSTHYTRPRAVAVAEL